MSKNIRTQIGKVIGKTLNSYHARVKPVIDDIKFKEQYQGRIIDCMVGEVDDNYIETPETDSAIVKLEHSKEGLVKVPSIKGKTILVDADGNETDTPAEGCKLVSVGEDEDNKLIILSKNKNLVQKVIIGDISNEDGSFKTLNSNKTVRSETHISVKPNTIYTISNDLDYSNYIYEYDINKNLIKLHKIKRNPYQFTTSNNTHYVAFRSTADEIQNDINVKYQLEEGTQATSYIEPKQHKTEILLNEPLRSLPNGVYDERVGKQLIKRIGKVILDGSETWIADNVRVDERTHWSAYTRLANMKSHSYYGAISNTMKSNYFLERKYDWCTGSRGDEHGMATIKENDKSQRILLSIKKEDMETQNIEGFKKWLSENPVTVLYELAEPIVEELPNGITLQGYNDTTMYIENSITPTVQYGYNALIPYKEELLTQKEEVETNTLDIEQNIIPYLMDMEFNLMLMEDNE